MDVAGHVRILVHVRLDVLIPSVQSTRREIAVSATPGLTGGHSRRERLTFPPGAAAARSARRECLLPDRQCCSLRLEARPDAQPTAAPGRP
eukprot:scaffold1355_cov268-Pinguiococcus_pyrenoidosus.AAC.10